MACNLEIGALLPIGYQAAYVVTHALTSASCLPRCPLEGLDGGDKVDRSVSPLRRQHRGITREGVARMAVKSISAVVVAISALLFMSGPLRAQEPTSPPPKIKQVLELLADPEVSAWLKANAVNSPLPVESAKPTAKSISGQVSDWFNQKRAGTLQVIAMIPRLPVELSLVGARLRDALQGQSALWILLLSFGVVLAGLVVESFLTWAVRASAARADVAAPTTPAVPLHQLWHDLAHILAFSVGGIGAVLIIKWPPMIGEIVLLLPIAVVAVRVVTALVRFLIGDIATVAPSQQRIIPISSASARLWYGRLVVLAVWIAIAFITMITLNKFGIADDARQLVRALFLLGAFVIVAALVWRQKAINQAGEGTLAALQPRWSWLDRLSNPVVLTALLIVLWVLMVGQMYGLFWFLLLLLIVPWALRLIQASFANVPRGSTAEGSALERSLWSVALERVLLAATIVGAAAILAKASELGMRTFGEGETVISRILNGVAQAVVIVLLADLTWHLLSVWMERSLQRRITQNTPDAARRGAKLRTLLPILRNVLLIFIIVVAGLMTLSGFGIEIGPLLAGAGILGVAVGFGAQTVVKDIISGMFYLLDDAFRVGEYIQSGDYKGTVEGFSLRSVRLRHHRGPLYTVPFSELGAIENMSRDWVIEKILVSVTYDTDLNKVKNVIKQIGKELLADPEFSPHIIETLKLQGVEEFADFSVDLRLKIKTVPGDAQFAIKRRAMALIKSSFDKAGIEMPFPTVQVAGERGLAVSAAAALNVTAGKDPAS